MLTLEILDSKGAVVNRVKSDDPVPPPGPTLPRSHAVGACAACPFHGCRAPSLPLGHASMRRSRACRPDRMPRWLCRTIHRLFRPPLGSWPGTYTVRLTAGGTTLSQPLVVRMDPRVKTSVADLQAQFDAAKSAYGDMLKATAVLHEGTVLRGQLKARGGQQPVQNADAGLQSKLDRVLGADTPGRGGGGRGGPGGPPTLSSLRLTLSRLEHQIENADAAPTAAQLDAIKTTAAAMPAAAAAMGRLETNRSEGAEPGART